MIEYTTLITCNSRSFFGKMTLDSGEANQPTVIKTIHPRRRRVRLSAPDVHSGEAKNEEVNDDVAKKNYNMILSGLYGSVSLIGRRKEMEDTVRAEIGFVTTDESFDFFGVYDGHGGATVAEACKERLHGFVAEEMIISNGNWDGVMERSFYRMDVEVIKEKTMGATAVVAVVGKEEVVVANCGDSRAVLCRSGVALPMSVDHKPDNPDELKRIEAAGGKVISWNGCRVLGVLATSRSIGDEYLKPFIISKPDVIVSKRTEKDEFLILASDGLWDVISNETACQIVRRCLRGRLRRKSQKLAGSSAAEAATVLAELAMAKGSRDNISVIVVEL